MIVTAVITLAPHESRALARSLGEPHPTALRIQQHVEAIAQAAVRERVASGLVGLETDALTAAGAIEVGRGVRG
jgi:hypothetical protein